MTHQAILYADRCKSPSVPGAAIASFVDRRIKSSISGMSDIGDQIHQHSPGVSLHVISCAHRCKSPVKSTHQVGRFYHMTFQNAPRWSLETRLKCHIAAIGSENYSQLFVVVSSPPAPGCHQRTRNFSNFRFQGCFLAINRYVTIVS